MAAAIAGKLVGAFCAIRSGARHELNFAHLPSSSFLQIRNYAARKGTRERKAAKKKKSKVVVEKKVFIPHRERGLDKSVLSVQMVRKDDSMKDEIPADDVWIGRYHRMKVYPFGEAIQCHKDTHSLGMLDAPDAFVKAMIELDMKGPKPSKNVGKFSRIAAVPHFFDHGENRQVLALCKAPELQQDAKNAGAAIAGGSELVQKIQTGEVLMADYEYVVAHPDIMADLVLIKGLLRRKFPAAHNGSLSINVPTMVHKFLHGVKYSGGPHERQILYGTTEVTFGKLNMEVKQLEENFAAIIEDLNTLHPNRPGPFIWRTRITTELKRELLKVDPNLYIKSEKAEAEDDDDDEPVAIEI